MQTSNKVQMTVTLKKQYPAENKGTYWSQGCYVTTEKGDFKAYNNGPSWFMQQHEGQQVDVMGEWKQGNKGWYLTCNFTEAGAQQGPTGAGPGGGQGGPPQQQNQQAPQQQPPQQQAQPQQQPQTDRDVPGMCRCEVICAAIRSGQIECKDIAAADYWVKYIIDGTNINSGAGSGPTTNQQPANQQPAGQTYNQSGSEPPF